MDATAAAGLRVYVSLVAAGLGAAESEFLVMTEPSPAWAYLALAGRLPHYPTHDVALTWDERHGWAAGVEAEFSELVPLVWLGETVLPAPCAVVRFATELYADQHSRQPRPPALRNPGSPDDDLPAQLAHYSNEHADS